MQKMCGTLVSFSKWNNLTPKDVLFAHSHTFASRTKTLGFSLSRFFPCKVLLVTIFAAVSCNMPWRVDTGIKVPVVLRNHINIMKDNAVKLETLFCFQISSVHHRRFVKYLRDCLKLQKGSFFHSIIYNRITIIIYRSRKHLVHKSFVFTTFYPKNCEDCICNRKF